MPKVSVIIPIYNVEKYLRQCLDSVVNQTLKDIEIICVDDGSPDKCGAIVDEYASNDKRIIAIHKENGGYASAINYGLEIANGEFISIVESDDFCELTMLEELYNRISCTDSDFIVSNFYDYNSENNIHIRDLSTYITLNEDNYFTLDISPDILNAPAFPWKNLYRASFLKEHNIKMLQDGNGAYEDNPFNATILSKAKKISFCDKPLYYYRRFHSESSSYCGKRSIVNYITRRMQSRQIILDNNFSNNDIIEQFNKSTVNGCFVFFSRIAKEYKEEYYNKMRELFYLIKEDSPTFIYFSNEEKDLFEVVLKYNYNQYNTWIILNKIKDTLFSIKKQSNHIKVTVLGISLSLKIKRD